MKILTVGFIAFASWSVFSTYIYVCKIKGLCLRTETTFVEVVKPDSSISDNNVVAEQVTIPKDLVIYFAFDRSDFKSDSEAVEYFNLSNAYLNNNKKAMVGITGHTDAVGTNKYNQALGLRRAQTIQRYLVTKGISENRISITSEGEENPVANNNSDEGSAKNRRSVVTIKQ